MSRLKFLTSRSSLVSSKMRFCADQIKNPKPKIWWLGRKFVARPLIFSEKHWFLPKSVYFVDFHQVRAFSRAETWTCRGVRALDGRSGLITSRNDPQRSPGRNTGGLRALALFLRALVLIDFFEFSIFENIFRFFMFFLENRFLFDKIFFDKQYISQKKYFFAKIK